MTIYRGVRLCNRQLGWLLPRIGQRLSPRSNAWWASIRGVAIAYATSPPVRPVSNAHLLSPVLLSAELEGFEIFSPTLPDLRTLPGIKLTLTEVTLL